MQLTYDHDAGIFVWEGGFETKDLPKSARFRWKNHPADPEAKVWWTDDWDRAAELIEYADASARAILDAHTGERVKTFHESHSAAADITVPSPSGLSYRPYQLAGIQFLNRQLGARTLLADEQGLGKTIQVAGLLNLRPELRRVLIVCPATLKLNWQKELTRWLVEPRSIAIAEGKSYPHGYEVVIINYDILHKHYDALREHEWDVLVADECHFAKNPRANRTKHLYGGKKKDAIDPIPCRMAACLTGTPSPNRPIELWPTIHFLAPDTFPNFFRWAIEFTDAKQTKYGWDFSGASNLEKLQHRLRSTCLDGDTQIELEYGQITIRELVSRQFPARVWSCDSMGRLSLQPVVGFSARPYREVLIEIRHATGSLLCTADHRVYTSKGEVRADQIAPGDYLRTLSQKKSKDASNAECDAWQPDVLFSSLRRENTAVHQERALHERQAATPQNTPQDVRGMRRVIQRKKRAYLQRPSLLLGLLPREMDLPKLSLQSPTVAGITREETAHNNGSPKSKAWRSTTRAQAITINQKGEFLGSKTTLGCIQPRRKGSENCPSFTDGANLTVAQAQRTTLTTIASSRALGRSERSSNQPAGNRRHLRRYSLARKSHHRSRWGRPRSLRHEAERPPSRRRSTLSRVLSIEVLDVGDRVRPQGGPQEDYLVYDIEVANNHNFFANGVLVHNCMLRRLKSDVLTELPPKQRQVIELPVVGAAAKKAVAGELAEYEAKQAVLDSLRAAVVNAEAAGDEATYREAVDRLQEGTQALFEEMAKLRYQTGMAKLPQVLAYLDDVIDEQKVVVFAWHRDVIREITSHFAGRAAWIMGGMAAGEVEQHKTRFQNDDGCRLIACNIRAGGVGHTLTAAALAVFAELDWTPGNISQAEDRIHRIGQEADSVLIQHLVLEGSLDARIARDLIDKQENIDRTLDVGVPEWQAAQTAKRAMIAARAKQAEKTRSESAQERRSRLQPAASTSENGGTAPALSQAQREALHKALRTLADACDFAHQIDGAGFNKMDAPLGHALAALPFIPPHQLGRALKLARRYRRQLPAELLKEIPA